MSGLVDGLPPVSIVVNTYNRAGWLGDALAGLQGLDYPAFEVIVVNGPSTDASADMIERWGHRIKARSCGEANLARSRNIGIAAASGAIVAFIDDDAVPHPLWLRRLVMAYRDPAVGAVGGFTIDNGGMGWQVRKTVCDRFGNAHNVTEFFDERPLNRPGAPFYPSLLGTNASFRAEALRSIGGFDHAFAYLLDETDVCLRLVDAGWRVVYEPEALVYHQFAPSHIRSGERVARTLYPSARSKAYFVTRHGGEANLRRAGEELELYRQQILAANAGLEAQGRIDANHRHSLDEDLLQGIDEGRRLAMNRHMDKGGDLAPEPSPPFKPFARAGGRRVVIVSQGWPPANETGIARFSWMLAQGLVTRGHAVHVLTRAAEGEDETTAFRDGLWLHRLHPDTDRAPLAQERYGLPMAQAAWAMRVAREAQFLRSFGIELVTFPIWDLEGLPLLDELPVPVVVSLHTTYAMARPFKPEWTERPLLAERVIEPVIAAETALLERAPYLLANSAAILDEIESVHGVDARGRATVVPHGTFDPIDGRQGLPRDPGEGPLRVLFLGRFEERKGFDIAVRVARALIEQSDIVMRLAGDSLGAAARASVAACGAEAILDHPRIEFGGLLPREGVNAAYCDADVVLMPSRFESFGLVAIEAMAAGKAVLALDAGGLGEVALPAYGARAFADGVNVVAAIVAEVVALAADRDEVRRRGALARQAFEDHFTVEAMVAGIEQFYENVLARHDSGGAER